MSSASSVLEVNRFGQDHDNACDQVQALRRSQQAQNALQRSHGFAQHLASSGRGAKPDESKSEGKNPPRQKDAVELSKLAVGSVAGVFRRRFDGRVEVQLDKNGVKTNWAAVSQDVRVRAIADELLEIVVGSIDNKEGKIAPSEVALRRVVKAALLAELSSADAGTLRFKSIGWPGAYRVWIKPDRSPQDDDRYSRKKQKESAKFARRLQKRAA